MKLLLPQLLLNLPDEILHEILSRLPLHSLLKCKAVCTYLRSLISNQKFVDFRRQWYLLKRQEDKNSIILWSPDHPEDIYSARRLVSGFEFGKFSTGIRRAKILGSCNGVLLLNNGRSSITDNFGNIIFYNPKTDQCNGLRWPHFFEDDLFTVTGLGHDSSSGEYKAVIGNYFMSPGCSPGPVGTKCCWEGFEALVFSSKTKQWKELRGPRACPFRILSSSVAVVVDGIPHWSVRSDTRRIGEAHFAIGYRIVVFDMRDDKFKELPQPYGIKPSSRYFKLEVGNLKGQLCSFITHCEDGRIDVWVMREYGVVESWAPVFTIPFIWKNLRPLCFTSDEEVLLTRNKRRWYETSEDIDEEKALFFYNPIKARMRKFSAPYKEFVAVMFQESHEWVKDFDVLNSSEDEDEFPDGELVPALNL